MEFFTSVIPTIATAIGNWIGNIIASYSSWWISGIQWFVDWIAERFNNVLWAFVTPISNWLDSLGDVTIGFPSVVFDVLNEITYGVGYILPLGYLLPIPIFMISFYGLKLMFIIFLRVKSFIPFWGN